MTKTIADLFLPSLIGKTFARKMDSASTEKYEVLGFYYDGNNQPQINVQFEDGRKTHYPLCSCLIDLAVEDPSPSLAKCKEHEPSGLCSDLADR